MSIQRSLSSADCELAFDNLTRQLYATDASIYQIEPAAVAFPRSAAQASSAIRTAADANIPITPRGAGSGPAGGAIGDGLIVDFSRHNRGISDLNLEPSCYSMLAEDYRELKLCDATAIAPRAFLVREVRRRSPRSRTKRAPLSLASKYELSMKVAAPLVQKISAPPTRTTIVASGTSCRHQIEHLTPTHPKRMVELLADALG